MIFSSDIKYVERQNLLFVLLLNQTSFVGGTMIPRETDMRNWKQEQLKYFRGYLDSFKKGSKEYKLLMAGIRELEKNL